MGIQCSAVQVDGRKGIQVGEVTGDAPREAGLKKGDLIVSANGVPVASLVEQRPAGVAGVERRVGLDQAQGAARLLLILAQMEPAGPDEDPGGDPRPWPSWEVPWDRPAAAPGR